MKKLLHYFWVLVFGILWVVILAILFRLLFIMWRHIDILSPRTYRGLAAFWNQGGYLKGEDLLMFFGMFLYFPICIFGIYKLYHFQFLKILTVPLNWIANYSANHYQAPNVNIKNLKVEEKKTLDQIVQERLDKEKKKNENTASTDFRKKIIKQIEENKNL